MGKTTGFVYFSRNIKYRVERVARWKRLIDQWKQNRKRFCLRATVPSVRNRSAPPPLPLERSSIKRRAGHTRPRATSAIFQRRETLSRTRLSTWIVAATEPISTDPLIAQHSDTAQPTVYRFATEFNLCVGRGRGLLVVRFLNEGRGGEGVVSFLKTFPFEGIRPRFRFPSIERKVGRKDGWNEDIFRSNRRVFRNRSFWLWLTNSFGGLVGPVSWLEEEGSEGMNSYRDGRRFLVRKKAVKSDGILLDIRNRS